MCICVSRSIHEGLFTLYDDSNFMFGKIILSYFLINIVLLLYCEIVNVPTEFIYWFIVVTTELLVFWGSLGLCSLWSIS